MTIHIHNTNIFHDLEINFWTVFFQDSLILYLIDIESCLIISYHFFVSVQPSRPSLLSQSTPLMFWLTITEEFRQNFGHVADVLDAGVDVVELGRKFQIWNEIKNCGMAHSTVVERWPHHLTVKGSSPATHVVSGRKKMAKNISSCRRQWVETNPYNIGKHLYTDIHFYRLMVLH